MTDSQLPALPEPTALIPLTGAFTGVAFDLPVRIYYAETDAGGVVYHGTYLALAERARTEMMRALGWPMDQFREETGAAFAARAAEIQYFLPARLDDLLIVRVTVTQIGGASLTLTHRFLRDGTLLAEARLTLVCVNAQFRPMRLPDRLRGMLVPLAP